MTLASRIAALATRVADEFNAVRDEMSGLGGGGSSWTQIALTNASGSSVSFNNIPQTYEDLLVTLEGVSHNYGSNANIGIDLSANGTSYSGNTGYLTLASANTTVWRGGIHFPNYKHDMGVFNHALQNMIGSSSPAFAMAPSSHGSDVWYCIGGVHGLKVLLNNGSFDAGAIRLWGR